MEGTNGTLPTSAAKPEATPEQLPDYAADSDADSWERDTDSEDDDETSAAHHYEAGDNQATREQEAGGSTTGNGNGGTVLQPAVAGESDESLSQTPSSTVSGPGTETNPFRRKMSQSSGLNNDFSLLTLNEASKNPWQPALDEQRSLAPSALSNAADQEPAQDIWASQVPSRAASAGPSSDPPVIQSLAPDEKAGWGDDLPEKSSIAVPPSFRTSLEDQKLEEDNHAWDDIAVSGKGKAPMKPPPIPGTTTDQTRVWGESSTDSHNGAALEALGGSSQGMIVTEGHAPGTPPRNIGKASVLPPPPPPRTPASGKTETYQVKNINWHDAISAKDLRKSPILIQNANGPCPLMALVNALTLTTPASAQDAVLVNTLKTREQISLDLLLDAVFDELMSDRRTTPDQSLPDITELYAFLKGLHTGMNVNPRFIPTEETETNFKRTSLTHLHPTERGNLIPGTFEDTREMSFYRIFQIPLIHGWLPPRDDPVYEALKRQAESYEDAQNVLFREEELDDKLSSPTGEGLSEEEQGIYQDILNIKSFLNTSATQLTPYGLEVITKAIRPGSVAILFRNDHFSTLYRHPQTQQLFALVTDAGYAGHDEIVWESLVDVNGERSEFFSGDFLVIGGPPQGNDDHASGSASASNGHEWTTVQSSKGKNKSQADAPPTSPEEQEDRDLALALQLQEEEDQRHRAEQAQRRREAQLSEQFIEQQAVRRGPANPRQSSNSVSSIPPGQRTSSAGGTTTRPAQQQVRPLVPPVLRSQGVSRPADDDLDDAPPPYEDAARQTPYVPPAGHPSHPQSSPSPSNYHHGSGVSGWCAGGGEIVGVALYEYTT
ncbi:hypothetical protein VMCG_03973 [Cytospora schulzeri]|uniref:MINDY deubiquitinase domain-containing protein n=1 Tax=Cytospora schulzeri TaxID=448051 RepID=A0A423WU52_9PEZI|nr:hypothetical protein VMCG_03973 [Valsa malicola]